MSEQVKISLRNAGFSQAPRVWVTQEQLAEILAFAKTNNPEVKRIRENVRKREQKFRKQKELTRDQEIELAWKQVRGES